MMMGGEENSVRSPILTSASIVPAPYLPNARIPWGHSIAPADQDTVVMDLSVDPMSKRIQANMI